MSFHAILALTCPTDADTKEARIAEEIVTMAEAVFAKGMSVPEDKEELEEEQEMWAAWWDRRLVCAGALWINWELTELQDLLQVSLQKARDHGMEPQVASHVIMKMEEAPPLYARWKTEVAARLEEVVQKVEEAQWVKEERWATPSMSFKLTGLLGGEVASGEAKGKGKVCMLMHVPNTHMLVVQHKVSVRSEVPFFRLMKVNPALSLVHGKQQWQRHWSGRWSTHARWIQTQCTHDQVQIVWEEQVAMHWTTWMNVQWVHKSQGKVQQIIGADWEEKGHKGGGYKGEGPRWVTIVMCIISS